MKPEFKFPVGPRARDLANVKKGESLIFAGHNSSVTATFFRGKFKFSTNQCWLVPMGKVSPVPVTVVTIIELPKVED